MSAWARERLNQFLLLVREGSYSIIEIPDGLSLQFDNNEQGADVNFYNEGSIEIDVWDKLYQDEYSIEG